MAEIYLKGFEVSQYHKYGRWVEMSLEPHFFGRCGKLKFVFMIGEHSTKIKLCVETGTTRSDYQGSQNLL